MKYKFFIIKKTINAIIKDGKKHKAINFYVNSLNYLKKKEKLKPLPLHIDIIQMVKPTLHTIRLKRGSKVIFLPKLLSLENQYKQGIKWLIKYAKKGTLSSFQQKLNNELQNTLKKHSKSILERNKVYSLLLDSRPYLYLIKYH